MEELTIYEVPALKNAVLVTAFSGWADAGQVASYSTNRLREITGGKKFAEIDPEEFYIFTLQRPETVVTTGTTRVTHWPTNEFYYSQTQSGGPDLVVMTAPEPHLHWKRYVDAVMELSEKCGVTQFLSLGGVLVDVPHTVEPQVRGRASDPVKHAILEERPDPRPPYQGPTSIHTPLAEAFTERNLETSSIWGSVPHYLQASPNIRVAYAMLSMIGRFLGLNLDLTELEDSAKMFDQRVSQAVEGSPELKEYVRRLEEAHASSQDGNEAAPPNPEAIISDLEDFLKRQRHDGGGSAS
jgi:proteasome assembly chaperone (PAC2) family protein